MVQPLDLRREPLEHLTYGRRGHVAVIVVDRPARGNSLTAKMHAGLRAIWEDVRDDPHILAAVVTGAGERHFCTGADIEALAERGTVSAGSGSLTDELFYTARQNDVWKPVVCAVNGLVAAAGLHFVADADIVVAATNASFTDTHVNVGMIGAVENIGLLHRLPLGAVLRLTLMGREYRMTAQRAYALGLVDELVELSELLPYAVDMADTMARNSPAAVALSQQAIWGALEWPYHEALERGWNLVKAHRGHPDAVEGTRAFVEGRPPRWASDAEGADEKPGAP